MVRANDANALFRRCDQIGKIAHERPSGRSWDTWLLRAGSAWGCCSTREENASMGKPRQRRETLVATIRASCPTCGDVELTSRDVSVQVCASNNQGSYAFRCPQCTVAISKLAEQRIVDLLVSSGVRLSVWSLPAELDEPRPTGPALGYDDLLEFHQLIQEDGWFEKLTDPVGRSGD